MKKLFKFLNLMSGVVVILFFVFVHSYAQEAGTSEPPSPPVEIQFNLQNAPVAGGEILLKLTVKALQDIHADISCLLPVGIESVLDESAITRPYEDTQDFYPDRQMIYREAMGLWVGPLKAGEVKEFNFTLKIQTKGKYNVIARIEALARWGVKEEVLTIEI